MRARRSRTPCSWSAGRERAPRIATAFQKWRKLESRQAKQSAKKITGNRGHPAMGVRSWDRAGRRAHAVAAATPIHSGRLMPHGVALRRPSPRIPRSEAIPRMPRPRWVGRLIDTAWCWFSIV
jgi:hypothetical protein